MSSEITLPSAASHADHIGQSTSIEQARAAAEVQALVVVAQNCPRNVESAVAEMDESCGNAEFAAAAFYDFTRGKDDKGKPKRIFDLTIVAMKELIRCWGNVQYSYTELRQDRQRHESEMLVWAWDMQRNNRAERRIVVPHVRNTSYGDKTLTDVRDVYELLTNNASRRLRECLKDVLPPWYLDRARKSLLRTLEHGGGVPLAERKANAVGKFAADHNVTQDQLERRLDRKSAQWTALDLAKLTTINTAITQGRATVVDEFPPVRLEAADLATGGTDKDLLQKIKDSVTSLADVERNVAALNETMGLGATHAQRDTLKTLLSSLEYNTDLDGAELDDIRTLVGRNDITGLDSLTPEEASGLIVTLTNCVADEHPGHALDAMLEHIRDGQDQ
jgi:hypothetical protein